MCTKMSGHLSGQEHKTNINKYTYRNKQAFMWSLTQNLFYHMWNFKPCQHKTYTFT